MTPVLQVALDIIQGDRAIQIAKEAIAGGADWIEAGTPLIKSEGMEIIRTLKRECPGKTIVADLKTMDVGALEADMAARSGADVVVIMGVSHDSTILEAVQAASKYGSKVMVDLMATADPVRRCAEVAELGASYACIHVAVDEQMIGGRHDDLKAIIGEMPLAIAVAGGITAENAPDFVAAGAEIIIVGGAISKSADVTAATKSIKDAIIAGVPQDMHGFKRYSDDKLMEAFSKVSTPNIADAQHRQGAMKGILPRNSKKVKMIGRALTVQTSNGDWAKSVEAVDVAKAGDVIVIDVGSGQTAVWGELASWSAKLKGISGVVVDGAVRDIEEIDEMGFPCFSKYVSPDAGEPKGFGGIGTPIVCGGARVHTGDWIIGDSNGVVVVPANRAAEIANRALDVLERENRIREEIKRGSTLSKVLELEKWEKV
ncbi:MAG: orotidine 5'-phosphate decarboxylase [Thermoplasmata archaeon]|nr:orotidine 5'-phosphate decarboxylase [Thermoplasmata archaeon]